MPFPRELRALNHPDFRIFFTAQLASQMGTWMQSVAQAWLVLQLTDSPFRLGLVGALQFGPLLLFSLLTGAIADRLPRRRLLVGTQSVMAGQALVLGLLVAAGAARYWHVLVLAALMGLANTVDTPARQSFVADMVGKADLVNAVALNSAAFNGARIVGPAVAGLLIGRFGLAPVFVINGLSFAGIIAALAQVRAEGRPAGRGPTTIRQEIGAGLRYARRTPEVTLILGVLLVVSLTVFNFSVYVPLLARHVFGLGAEGFGFLMAAVGLGAMAGALTLGASRAAHPPLRTIAGAAVLACAGVLGISAAGDVRLVVPLLFLVGFAGITTAAGCNTSLQLIAPDALRGRIMSLHVLVFGGSFPIGALVVGAVSERWGVSTALLAGGGTGLLGLAAIGAWWRLR